MAQIYEIYCNTRKVMLIDRSLLSTMQSYQKCLFAPYLGKIKSLFQYIDTIENSNRFETIVLHSDDIDALWYAFKSVMENIKAAGGLITNSDNNILLIMRRAHWDLPKGKLEKNEDFKTAAIRECEEEVGLHNLQLIKKICNTYHIYRDKSNNRILKTTKWYHLHYPDKQEPILQSEEDIDDYAWCSIDESKSKQVIYSNILDVLNAFSRL